MWLFVLAIAANPGSALKDPGTCGKISPPPMPRAEVFACPEGTRRVDSSAEGIIVIECLGKGGVSEASLMDLRAVDGVSSLDRKNGVSLMYTKNRVVSWRESREGKPIGLHVSLNDDGSLASAYRYSEEGAEICGRFYENGRLIKRKDDGKEWVWLDENGMPRSAALALSKKEIQDAFARVNAQMKFCYDKQLSKMPTLRGKITLAIHIEKGRASRVAVAENSFPDEAVPSCVRKIVERMAFPLTTEPVDIRYPFSFQPQ